MNRTLLWTSWRSDDRWQECWVAFSSDGKLLIYIASPVKVQVSYAETGEIYATIGQDNTIIDAVSFSPNGKLIAILDQTCTIRLWNVATKNVAHKLQLNHSALYMSFCPSGRFLNISGRTKESIDLEHTLNGDDRSWIKTKYSSRWCNDWIPSDQREFCGFLSSSVSVPPSPQWRFAATLSL
jgi:WD40 repeat protein